MTASPHPRIAYLVNQYPKVSHSFVRREILALEDQGFDVLRVAVRGWDGDLVDKEDLRERARTRFVLKSGALPLLVAMIRTAILRPCKFAGALALAFRMSRYSDRPLAIHLVYLAEACAVLAWLREAQVQHVHAHFGTNPAELAMLVRVMGGPTYSFTAHGPEEFDRPLALHLADKIRAAAFVIAVSSFGSSQLRRWVDLGQWPKIHVVHCGLDEAFYDGATTTAPTGIQLVCVGRLCEQKGQLLLVMAAAELARRGRDFRLVLVGDGEMRGEIEALVARCGLGDRVRITGWLSSEQVRDEILASRALVLPSFAEGLPVVIMEAMALRRPVLSTYIAGIPELVRPGQTGWLVPAGDMGQLADAMDTVLSASDQDLATMGALGHDRVVLHHSARNEARKLAAHFRDALSLN
jgi:glycosyltransferase involved in cell wall biosynthesis